MHRSLGLLAAFLLSSLPSIAQSPQEPSVAPQALPEADPKGKADPRLLRPKNIEAAFIVEDGTPLTLTIGTGYALRLHRDDRVHGAMGRLALDIPLFFGFGVRGETVAYAWGPSPIAPRPLVLPQLALSLLYVVDEGPVTGIIGVGASGGLGLDIEANGDAPDPALNGIYAGAMFSVGLRFRLGPTTHLEILGQLPVLLWEPTGLQLRAPFGSDGGGLFPFQPSVSVGITFEPLAFVAGVFSGEPVWNLVAPAAFGSIFDVFGF